MNKSLTSFILSLGICATLSAQNQPSTTLMVRFDARANCDSIINTLPGLSFERVFPEIPDPETEARHRHAGLHLFYKVDPGTTAYNFVPSGAQLFSLLPLFKSRSLLSKPHHLCRLLGGLLYYLLILIC